MSEKLSTLEIGAAYVRVSTDDQTECRAFAASDTATDIFCSDLDDLGFDPFLFKLFFHKRKSCESASVRMRASVDK